MAPTSRRAEVRTKVVLIVSGGIAAYKAPDLVRKLIARGCEVAVVMTEAAAAFCTPLSLATVSGRPVRSSLLDVAEEGRVGHIEIADWAELVLVAPATADLMARAAHGRASDLASTLLLATQAPVLWAPAMNTNMWGHPATRANLVLLRNRGAEILGPDRGDLACGWVGVGRMLDPERIAEAVQVYDAGRRLGSPRSDSPRSDSSDWAGRRVLVTAGPTRAYLDPVRFISNASTGTMGFCLAQAAQERGAEVVLVAGPVALPTPVGVRRVDVETGTQMLAACRDELARAPTDLLTMVAAVADLRPESPAAQKVSKEQILDGFAGMRWQTEVDILATLVGEREAGRGPRMLGFGAQTVDPSLDSDPVELSAALVGMGEAKLARKGCDALFVNRVGVAGTGFGSPTNAGALIFAAGTEGEGAVVDAGPPRAKLALAEWMLDELGARWGWS